jgi:monoamine oxidase
MNEVLVIGAGVAGLAAARALRQRDVDVVVVEARLRPGGRVHTIGGDGWPAPLEEGAEFVHGRDPTLMRLLRGLHADVIDDHHLVLHAGQLSNGNRIWDQAQSLMEDDVPSDRSMRERIAAGQVSKAARDFALAYVEGFHAARPERAGARAISEQTRAAEAIHGDELRRVREGYSALVARLCEDVGDQRIHYGAVVDRITWSRHRVTIALRSSLGRRLPPLTARRAIITLPLGVLKSRAVRFSPALPVEKRRAIGALAMGNVIKIALRFREPWWCDELSFVHARRAAVPTWWRPLPFKGPMLIGWAGGPSAARFDDHSPESIARSAIKSIARTLRTPLPKVDALLQAWHVVDWGRDPFSRGAYSWVPVGAARQQAALCAPIDDTLFFAGEACNSDGASGTVHGAIATGLSAAAAI